MTRYTVQALKENRCYINGQWVAGADTFDVINPASGEVIAAVPRLGADHTRQAIQAAHDAGPAWRKRTAHDRAALLRKWHALILEHAHELARVLTEEMGKPLAEAHGEVLYGASYIEWFAEECKRVYGEIIPSPHASMQLSVIRQPVGVVAAITPWNFPNAMLARKLAPALAAGCTVVAKPAEQTPLSAFALAKLAEAAGIPPGVINVITGDPVAIGGELTRNPLVRKLTFTGSTNVGKLLISQCAPTVKRMSMELGGNAPFIVFDDADLDAAVDGAIAAKFRNAGQTCVCANRLFVQAGIHDEFAERLAQRVSALKVGDGFDPDVNIGPLIDANALRKVEAHVADALEGGASVAAGGKALQGLFYAPTVLRGVTPLMRVASEEIFGPVAPLLRFDDEEDMIRQANQTEAGLAAYFYTSDLRRAHRVAHALEVGMVGINTGSISTPVAPFGGIKQSGYGREGSHHGLEDYLDVKYLCTGNLD